MTWTHFMDMHSGGRCKEPPYLHIFIEAPKTEAIRVFYAKFGHSPLRVSCTCCGDDYSIHDFDTIEEATAYERGLAWVEDVRGHLYPEDRPDDYLEGRYIEPFESIPDGMRYRKRRKNRGMTVREFLDNRKDVLLIREGDIRPEWRLEDPPVQGFVWVE